MTASPPDPDPATTPGLEPGGGVPPGETPPDSGSTTRGLSHPETKNRSRAGAIITFTLVLLVVLSVVGFIIADIGGYIDLF